MAIDPKIILIMQDKNKNGMYFDVTSDIVRYYDNNNCYKIQYKNNATLYPMSKSYVSIYTEPKEIEVGDRIVYYKDIVLNNIVQLIVFGDFYKVFYNSSKTGTYPIRDIKIVKKINNLESVKTLMDYLQEVAQCVASGEEKDFLASQLSKIDVLEDSVLAKFLSNRFGESKHKETIICPFSTNEAQQKALKIALEDDISIIQGPPGTGKTQTILNIIANYVINDKKIAVVSGNNEATKNVYDKLRSAGFGEINAFLGNSDNIESFFVDKKETRVTECKCDARQLLKQVSDSTARLNIALSYEVDIAKSIQLIGELETEKAVNDAEYNIEKRTVPKKIKKLKYTSKKLLELAIVLENMPGHKIKGFFNRVRMLFRYGIIKVKEIEENIEDTVLYLKNNYYKVKIKEIGLEIKDKQKYLSDNKTEELKRSCEVKSQFILKNKIDNILTKNKDNQFTKNTYKDNFVPFVKRYPVIYSTTNAIASCSQKYFLYDCIIIDESSQVDLITAVIAFSMAKKVVLVGDENQITNVVDSRKITQLNSLYINSKLDSAYDYTKNNILQCINKKYGNKIKSTLLVEHFRCDPQIINFCSKRFYNNQLVVRTKHNVNCGVEIIKHAPNFERNRANERQIDIIIKEIMPNINTDDVGIVAPYNNQVNLLKERLQMANIDTVHKFQGKEKDCIILSTVANRIKFYEDETKIDFLNNPNLLNVAISRAKKKLYIIVSKEILEQEGSILRDMAKYYEYYCSETKVLNTNVYSVFDLMYSDYSSVLDELNSRLVKISEFKSENIIATIIKEICESNKYGTIAFLHDYSLKNIIKQNNLTNQDDIKFVKNPNTHCDFIIYNTLNKEILLIIEVDGSQHQEKIQADRDARKDRLLKDAGLKLLRLPTTTIECKEKIIECLTSQIKS